MKKPLVLWGGTDINSSYYGKKSSLFTQRPNNNRDRAEFEAAREAVKNGVPIVGVCRGAQILCVLNGGELFQHSVPEEQNHPIVTYDNKTIYDAPGCHHQIMVPKGDFKVLAVNPGPTQVWYDDGTYGIEYNCPEVVWWPEHGHFGVQAHPEWCSSASVFLGWINNELQRLGIDYSFSKEDWR